MQELFCARSAVLVPLRLRPFVVLIWVAAVQRKEPVATTRFPAAQFHESWSRPAAACVGRQWTHNGHWE
jgi:hypothetical protein